MSAPRVKVKWRPSIGLIVHSVLLVVAVLPVATLVWFRIAALGVRSMEPAEIVALVAIFIITLGVAYVLTRTITGPIHKLVERIEEISRGGKARIKPLDNHGTREIAHLSQSFLDMAGTLVDHTEYVRSFATHVSHELKSPLTSIRGAAELLLDDEGDIAPVQRERFLTNIIADAERLDLLLTRLRELAHAELASTGGETSIAVIAPTLGERFPELEIIRNGGPDIAVAISPEAAGIVFSNLAGNSLQHGATRLTITAKRDGGKVDILIEDNGSGVLDGNKARIFQPFFSTRREEGGTGVGLGIARSMLAANGGTIELAETGAPGAAFAITIPAAL